MTGSRSFLSFFLIKIFFSTYPSYFNRTKKIIINHHWKSVFSILGQIKNPPPPFLAILNHCKHNYLRLNQSICAGRSCANYRKKLTPSDISHTVFFTAWELHLLHKKDWCLQSKIIKKIRLEFSDCHKSPHLNVYKAALIKSHWDKFKQKNVLNSKVFKNPGCS